MSDAKDVKVEDDFLSSVPDIDITGAKAGSPESSQAGTPTGEQGSTKNPEANEDGPKYNAYWDVLANKLSTEDKPFEIPEYIKTGLKGEKEITPNESFEELVSVIQKNTRIPELEDPFVRSYLEAKSAGDDFKFDNFIQSYAVQEEMKSLNDFDYMFKTMQQENGKSEDNPDGYSDEDIREHLEGINKITLHKERLQHESTIEAKRAEAIKTSQIRQQEQLKDRIIEMETREKPLIEETLNRFIQNPNINGIEFGESDIKDAAEEFRILNKYDENGNKPLFEIFQDNDNLFKAYMVLRYGGLVKQIFGGMKNEASKNILERLQASPGLANRSMGGGSSKIPTASDFLEN